MVIVVVSGLWKAFGEISKNGCTVIIQLFQPSHFDGHLSIKMAEDSVSFFTYPLGINEL